MTAATNDNAPILIAQQGPVLCLTLNRPAQLNALTQAMYASLAGAITNAQADESIRCLLITGNGDAFTAGNDLKDFAMPGKGEHPPVLQFLDALHDNKKPLIAAVNGPAVGVGLTMLPHCDLVCACPEASFKAPFTQIGLVPEAGSSLLLPQILGLALASDMLLTGRSITATEALAHGLVARLYDRADLLPKSLQLALQLASLDAEAITMTKGLIRHQQPAVRQQMDREAALFMQRLQSPSFQQAVAAFFAKKNAG